MSSDTLLRQEFRYSLNNVRSRIRSFTGLYSNESLTCDVLHACDEMMLLIGPDTRLDELRLVIEDRCTRLAQVADRFSDRDPTAIATARAQAIAAIDLLQDALFRLCRSNAPDPRQCGLLRRRSL